MSSYGANLSFIGLVFFLLLTLEVLLVQRCIVWRLHRPYAREWLGELPSDRHSWTQSAAFYVVENGKKR